MNILKVYKTHPEVNLPEHQTKQSACFDIAFQGYGKGTCKGYSTHNKPFERIMHGSITISPGDRVMVPTGMILDIPEGYSVRIHARSGMSLKQGLVLANAEGVIDSDYTEELFILIHNISGNPITIKNGDRVAQGELVKNIEYAIEQTSVRPIPVGNRVGGFGSTGVTTKLGTIILNTIEDIPDFVKTKQPTKKTVSRGRPKKNASSS